MADMATTWELVATSAANVLGTDFDSKASDYVATLAHTLDATNGEQMYLVAELQLGTITPAASGYVLLELFPSYDGTNYSDIVAEQGNGSVSRTALSGAGTKRIVFPPLLILPLRHKFVLTSKLGTTTNASGNNFAYKLFREKGKTI
jgi:hypothetical protein